MQTSNDKGVSLQSNQRSEDAVFFHSEHRMIPWLRELHPDPIMELHARVVEKHGIKDGNWIFIESPKGKIKELYYREGKSLHDIGKKCGCTRQNIMRLMKKYGLKRRTLSEARIQTIRRGKV